jgi:hypothetical protein
VAKTRELKDRSMAMKPYVERALTDEKVRDDVRDAIAAAREIYDELIGNRRVTHVAARMATDKDIQENLRRAIDDMRKAADRVQGKESHKARNTILFAGIVAGILFNPMTGPATREWLKDLFGGSDPGDFGEPAADTGDTSSSNGS